MIRYVNHDDLKDTHDVLMVSKTRFGLFTFENFCHFKLISFSFTYVVIFYTEQLLEKCAQRYGFEPILTGVRCCNHSTNYATATYYTDMKKLLECCLKMEMIQYPNLEKVLLGWSHFSAKLRCKKEAGNNVTIIIIMNTSCERIQTGRPGRSPTPLKGNKTRNMNSERERNRGLKY